MRRSFAVVPALLLFALPLVGHADDASKRVKIEQMLTLTKTDTVSQTMLASVPVRVKSIAARQPMVEAATSPEQKKLADDYLNQMGTIASSGAKWETIKPKIIDAYMTTFSEPDLDGILAFFKTPAGQVYLAKSGELSKQTVDLLQGAVSALQPQFEAATKAFQTNLQKTSPAGPASRPASAPPTLGPATAAPNSAAPAAKKP